MSLPSLAISSYTTDSVQVVDSATKTQVFKKARPLNVNINPNLQYMSNPIEDGTLVTDHFIILPTEIDIDFIISSKDYGAVYSQIDNAAKKATTLTIRTKAESYENMHIAAYPSVQDTRRFNALSIRIKFREVQLEVPVTSKLQPGNVKSANDSSTVNKGGQSATENESVLASLVDKVKGLF